MVNHWTTNIPGDYNHRNQHAQVEGSEIEFCAFPYQPYTARLGDYSATIGNLTGKWTVNINVAVVKNGNYTGATFPILHKTFDVKDEAFEWANRTIVDRNRLFSLPKDN